MLLSYRVSLVLVCFVITTRTMLPDLLEFCLRTIGINPHAKRIFEAGS